MKCAVSSFELTRYKRDEDKLERVQQRKGHQCGQGLEQMTFKGKAEVNGLVWPGE